MNQGRAVSQSKRSPYSREHQEAVYELIQVGFRLPEVTRQVTLTDHFKYLQASHAVGLMHLDRDYARGVNLPDIVLAGHMRIAFMAQLVTDWVGGGGTLRRISARQKGVDHPGHPLRVAGIVTRKYVAERERLVDLDVWVENETGDRTCEGAATVLFPGVGEGDEDE